MQTVHINQGYIKFIRDAVKWIKYEDMHKNALE